MSDLISRSELIENFRKCYSGHLGMENSDSCMTFHGICNVINNTNTVYDIDNVVEELEKREEHYVEMLDWQGQSAICDAIEIVKQGGVDDDVCECRLLKGYNFLHKTSCGDVFDMENGFKFCPYCGKKIKIVGD